MRRLLAVLVTVLLLTPAVCPAAETGEIESVSITVYNDNLALIKEVRPLALSKGIQDVVLSDVSGMLRPETVHLAVPGLEGVSLLEQNYDYDLVSRSKLLEKFIGSEITVVDDEHGIEYRGMLLSVADGLVMDAGGNILLDPPGRVVLPEGAADELLLRPTLSWMLYSPQSVSKNAEITYMSDGLSWNADYVLLLNKDDSEGSIEGWVTLSNYSGTTYRDAELKLIAGDVNVVEDYDMGMSYAAEPEMMMDGLGGGGFEEEEFFEYHLYDLQRPTTIRNNQQKQVGLLSAAEVPVEKIFVFQGQWGYETQVFVEFTNEEESGMGMPLPAGTVRVFKADSEGDVQFVGEDWIDHTPRDEDVRLLIGNAFDIKGETIQVDYKDIGDGYIESYKVTLKNHKETEDVVVTVPVEVWGDWRIIRSNYDYVEKSATMVEFNIPVKADGEAVLEYAYKVTWK